MAMSLDYRAIFAATPNPYMVVDRELRYVAANAAYLSVTQSKLEDLLGRRVIDVFPNDPDDPNNDSLTRLRSSLERVLRTGKPDFLPLIPYRIEVGSGSDRHYENLIWSASHTPLLNEAGSVEFVLQHTVDVTKIERAGRGGLDPDTALVEAGILGRAEQVQAENLRLRELQQIFSQAPGFVCFLRGPEFVFEFANAAYYQLVGHRDILGKPIREALPELSTQVYQRLLGQVLESGESFVGHAMRVELQNSPGAKPDSVFVDFVYQPVLDANQRAFGVLVHGYDITQQKRTEDALRKSEERFRSVVAASAAGTWEIDLPGGDLHADARTCALFGLPASPPPTGEVVLARVHAEDRFRVRAALNRALAGDDGGKYSDEFRTVSTGEPERWVEVKGQVTFDRTGRPQRFVGGTIDITERKRSDIELLRLARVLDESRDFIGIANLDGEPLFINEAALRLVGLPDRKAAWKFKIVDYFVERQRGAMLDEVLTTTLREGHWQGEMLFRHFQTGEEIPVLYSIFGLPDPSGQVTALATITRDLRAQKAAERERAELLSKEKAARALAEDANRLKDEFLATVSHELRTPLTAMLGWIHLLNSDSLPKEKARHALEIVERNARAQAQLIDDLLDVSRIMSGKLVLDRQLVDVAGVVASAIDTVRPVAEAKGVALEIAVESGSAVLGDAHRLQQVIWNLLSNAVKFTPRDGRVRVSLEVQADSIEVVVADTGIGIASEFLPFVFERFRQAEGGTTRRLGGLGLGLSIVRNLVIAHGGDVVAKSEGPGQGATFVVRLPKASAASLSLRELRRPFDRAELDELEAAPELRGTRVLLVDDEADTRQFIAALLERLGADVTECHSVRDALAALGTSRFDVLLSDIGMPEEDGYGLIKRVRALSPEGGGRIPAVALTAYARIEDRAKALRAGFQHHVTKPVRPEELIAVLGALTRPL